MFVKTGTNLFYYSGVIILGLAQLACSDTLWTACSQAELQSAFDRAGNGDTVFVKEGSATWLQPVTVNSKTLHIFGAGAGKSVVTTTSAIQAFRFNCGESRTFRCSGFSFNLSSTNPIAVLSKCKQWRIDHCRFNSTQFIDAIIAGDLNAGPTYGLIDNCHFFNCRVEVLDIDGQDSWKRPLSLGSTDAVYVEDCTFEWTIFGNSIDCNHGARYVARYNEFVNSSVAAHSLQNAGSATLFSRATRSVEVYHNTFIARANAAPPVPNWIPMGTRGGTGVYFSNKVINESGDPYEYAVGIDNVRSFQDPPPNFLGSCDGSNPLDGNEPVENGSGRNTSSSDGSAVLTCDGKNWTANAFAGYYLYNLTDGSRGRITANTAVTVTAALSGGTRNNWNRADSFKIANGYPCLDQIGRSTDHGPGSDRLPQALDPLYAWDNTLDGKAKPITVLNNTEKHIKEGRDYFNSSGPKPGYQPLQYPHPLRNGDAGQAVRPRHAGTSKTSSLRTMVFGNKIIIALPAGKKPSSRLTVYDVAGREVARIFNVNENKDGCFFEWDCVRAGGGVYFFAVKTNDGMATWKLLVGRE